MLLCERRLNQMKGRILNREVRPANGAVMAGQRDDALNGDTQAEETMFDNIGRLSQIAPHAPQTSLECDARVARLLNRRGDIKPPKR